MYTQDVKEFITLKEYVVCKMLPKSLSTSPGHYVKSFEMGVVKKGVFREKLRVKNMD